MKYFGSWSSWEDMKNDIHVPTPPPADFPTEDEVIFAAYGGGGYDGTAIVVWERDGKLYEMNGSHCSCYGLDESMGGPEETSKEALGMWEFSHYDFEQDMIDRFKELFPKVTNV